MELKPPPRVGAAFSPFDLDAALRRNAEFVVAVVEFGFTNDPAVREAAAERYKAQWAQSLQDHAEALEEIKRLHGMLRALREQHLPFAGEAGAPAMCTACSLHGAQIAWPCDLYRTITAALPERKP